jgi:peptide chain release factor subunit 1
LIADQEIVYEKKVLEKFFETLGEKPDLAYYKEKDVRRALEYGAVEVLILSKKFDKKISKELIEMAENIGSRIEIVSIDTTEGEQFNNLSGVGAILRYKIQ